jgi:hypothetical protein
MSNEISKKLRLGTAKRALVLNAPEGYLDMLLPFPEGVHVTDQADSEQAYDFVQVFMSNIAEVESWAPKAIQAVTKDGLLWLNYPKGTGKIKTDINRDAGWQSVTALGYEGVALVSINETWSAMRFRPINQVKSPRSVRLADRVGAVKTAPAGDKTVIVPDELAESFKASPAAAAYYETLAYTHRKEYVRWITEAKREETRSTRVAKTVDKLERGIKNPMVKD